MIIKIRKVDLLKGQVISPDWYTLRIKEFTSKVSSKGDSQNYVYTFQVCKKGSSEADTDSPELDHNFNSKAIGMMANFIAAVQKKTLKEVLDSMDKGTLDWDTDRDTPAGTLIQAKIENEPYEGRLVNKIGDSGKAFLPVGAQVPF